MVHCMFSPPSFPSSPFRLFLSPHFLSRSPPFLFSFFVTFFLLSFCFPSSFFFPPFIIFPSSYIFFALPVLFSFSTFPSLLHSYFFSFHSSFFHTFPPLLICIAFFVLPFPFLYCFSSSFLLLNCSSFHFVLLLFYSLPSSFFSPQHQYLLFTGSTTYLCWT